MKNVQKIDLGLTGYDELFANDEERKGNKLPRIFDIPISEIDDFPDHPFKVKIDEDMDQLVQSIKERGIITPVTLRPKEDGRYEIVSGHRRKKACELAGLDTVKAEVREMSRDEASNTFDLLRYSSYNVGENNQGGDPMRKSFTLVILAALLCLSGCESVSQVSVNLEPESVSETAMLMPEGPESSSEPVATIESSVDINEPVAEETEEKAVSATTTEVEPVYEDAEEVKVDDQTPEEEATSSFEPVITSPSSEAAEETPSAPKTPVDPPKETEQPKPTEPPAPPEQPEPPAETEQPAPTEPIVPEVTEPPAETQPKTAYDYEFDINAIRADCIVIGQGMGYTLNTSLTPQNATWWNPVTASESNQGATLKSSLEQYICFHTVANLGAYGMDEITEFNIYCESRGGGSYAIFFVFA